MAVFAIIGVVDIEKIANVIAKEFPEEHLRIKDDEWLVLAERKTTRDISNMLGITITTEEGKETVGPSRGAIVLGISNFWGAAEANVWEWVATKWSK